MIQQVTIQRIWSPPGKEFPKVITSPEQERFHLYADQKDLAPHLRIGSLVSLDVHETTNQKGQPIRRIQNVIIDDKPIIPEPLPGETPKREISGEERGLWWKEVGLNFRAGLFKKDEGNGALLWRAYITQMLASLELTIGKSKEE